METLPESPNSITGLAPFAAFAFQGGDLRKTGAELIERCNLNHRDANGLMDLSIVLQLLGRREDGLAVQAAALGLQSEYRTANRSEGRKIRLLALKSAGDLTRNNAIEFLVQDLAIELIQVFVDGQSALPDQVPDHDVAMVAVCQSELNRGLLEHLSRLLANWHRPVLCMPDKIDRLSRDGVPVLLKGIPGLHIPVTQRVKREALESMLARSFVHGAAVPDFPFIVRPVDSDKGFGLSQIQSLEDLADYLNVRQEGEFFVAPWIDYRSRDGQFRKYRIVLIDNKPYVCHLAISSKWMVHYMTAGMFESPEKRREEEHCFEHFDLDFACRHRVALAGIAQRIGLEYVGMDCAETQDGRLLIFEVDSGMTVHAMDPQDLFPYKKPQMRKVFAAFEQMLHRACSKVARSDGN